MESSKKKRSSHSRKRRVQLDDDADSYSKNRSNGTTSEVSYRTRHSSSSRPATISSTDCNINIRINTSASSSHDTLQTTESRNQNTKTTPVTDNTLDTHDTENVASTSSPNRPVSTSPDPNCAICLGKLENKSFTDSCFHQFCFVCLVEWSKVKAECPLCKQSFKSIVHNVRSYDDYDQYHIPPPEDRNPVHELSVAGGLRFRYRTTVTDHRYATLADRINREIESRLLQRPSRTLPIPNYRRLRQPANSDFRRNVYLQRLKLNSDPLNTRRRVRETSPTFFRDNQAQTHRLVPWLNRELIALLHGHGEQTAFVLDLIMGLIKRYPIDSEEFYQHVFPYVGRHTRQFMREFLMFAKSPYHMAAYDRHCSYGPSDERQHDSGSDSDHQIAGTNDGNDSDVSVIVVSPGNSPVQGGTNIQPPPPRRRDPNLDDWEASLPSVEDQHMLGFAPIMRTYRNEDLPSLPLYTGLRSDNAPTSASGWDSPTPGPSQVDAPLPYVGYPTTSASILSSRHSGIGGSIWTPSFRSYSAPISQPLPSTSSIFGSLFPEPLNLFPRNLSASPEHSSTAANSSIIHADSDSNNSDIEIVDVEKPWVERSPIKVSSGGDTDYDVMITGTTHINDPVKTEKKKKKHKRKDDDNDAVEVSKEKKKKSGEKSKEKHSKKKHYRSRSPIRHSLAMSRSASSSPSPIRLTICRPPSYQHKKFSYKTVGDEGDEILHFSKKRSRSLSSTDSDTETLMSRTAHKKKSKTKQSSIDVVDHRKKSSKVKKNKKHKKNKGKDKERESVSSLEPLHYKHRKHSTSSLDNGSAHKKHKHKSKKKKHHKQKKAQSPSLLTESDNSVCFHDNKNRNRLNNRKPPPVYTSDSDSDSIISDFEGSTEKSNLQTTTQIPSFTSGRLEFVELDAEKAAAIDEELDQLSKTLNDNDYIGSLLRDTSESQRKNDNIVLNANHHRIDDLPGNNTSFKKHPYGHKKTKTSQQHQTEGLDSVNSGSESLGLTSSQTSGQSQDIAVSKQEDNIQSHDISSCTDIEKQLPSFLTFSSRNSDMPTYPSALDFFNIPPSMTDAGTSRCYTSATTYDSPTSTNPLHNIENEPILNTVPAGVYNNESIDVDTVSDDSDVGITGESVALSSNNSVYRINPLISHSSDFIDVVNHSDEEDLTRNVDRVITQTCSSNVNTSVVESISGDSDIECSFIEGHKTFEIDGDTDDEVNDKRGEKSEEIDVTTNSDEEREVPVGDVDRINNASDQADSNSNTKSDLNEESRNKGELSNASDSETDRYSCNDDTGNSDIET